MKTLKFSLLVVLFVTGTLFAMEEPEASSINLAAQDELWAGIKEHNPEKVRIALENGADPNEYKVESLDHSYRPLCKLISNMWKDNQAESFEIARYLLKFKADPLSIIQMPTLELPNSFALEHSAIDCLLTKNIKNNSFKKKLPLIYPLAKLFYEFGNNKNNIYKRIKIDRSLNFFPYTEEEFAEYDFDWKKTIVFLFLSELIKDERFSLEHDSLKEIKSYLDFEERYGSIHNYVQKRQYGIPLRNKTHRISTLPVNSNDNSDFAVMNDANINNSKEEV